jgi:probable F420-dependent oxidoreductase
MLACGMRFSVELPVFLNTDEQTGNAHAAVAQGAEACGFHGCWVTDHPFPTERWLRAGGHVAHDPFVALSFAAAATRTLRLQTHILVLPYRNPFLVAKSAASLDVLSGGRLTLGVGAGYLHGEFAALGCEFDQRQARMEEAIVALRRALGEDDLHMQGAVFRAEGNSLGFRPMQRPHLPIWLGGNSRTAMERAARLGDGWAPFPTSPEVARIARTARIGGRDELARKIEAFRQLCDGQPRDICYAVAPEATREDVAQLGALGVTWLTVQLHGETVTEYTAEMRRFAERHGMS